MRTTAPIVILCGLIPALGCIGSQTNECSWGLICPPGMTCDAVSGECIFPAQRDSCVSKPDGRSCTFPNAPEGSFYCVQGICLPVQCGDGVTHEDPAKEVCDDGNTTSGDGCSADCLSDETCGNGYRDAVNVEQCDDGNNVDSDGCTADCAAEYPGWKPRTASVPARFGTRACYDSVGQQVLLFGGTSAAVPPLLLSDTWAFDGVNWRPVETDDAPAPRMDHGLTYDASRQQMVVFGGWGVSEGAGTAFDDTWTLSGNTWSEIDQPTGPLARSGLVLAFDSHRGRTVLFGGETASRLDLDDTWEFDGTDWNQVITPVAPPPRRYSSMTYDPGRRRCVLFGGAADPDPGDLSWDYFADTWEYDGTEWRELSTVSSPPARYAHSLVYDAGTGNLTVHGGFDSSGPLRDTWVLIGQQWEMRTAWHSPTPRSQFAMAHHAALGQTVLFGGTTDGHTALDDTWIYEPPYWGQAQEAPPSRASHAMIYDPDREVIVLFGGVYHSRDSIWDYYLRNDTWEYDGRCWRRVITPEAPSPRCRHAMAYDQTGQRVVLFGGTEEALGVAASFETVLEDTWSYDGTTWTRLAPPVAPAGRAYHAMAYDAINENVVLFGGGDGSDARRDTWIFDGGEWTLKSESGPQPRLGAAVVYDAGRGLIVLFGGGSESYIYNDTWEWDGTDWQMRHPSFAPTPRYGAAMTYSHVLSRAVLFGGRADVQLGDTWEYDGEEWIQIPLTGILSARFDSRLVDFPVQRRALLLGGITYNTQIEGDFWQYLYSSL